MKLTIITTLAVAASAAAVALAPLASASVDVQENPGNAQISAAPGPAAQEAAQDQQPFGGASGALIFHR